MGKTIAQSLIEKGKQEGMAEGALEACQRTLIRLLRKRFRDVPADIVRTIEATEDIAQLDKWLDQFATAKSLRDVGIGSAT